MKPRLELHDGCRVLVTGGAGFIGSHLVEEILRRGCRVDVLDDFSTGRTKNLELDHANLKVVTGSVTDARLVNKVIEDAEVVFHLAAAVGALSVHEDPLRTIDTNITGTRAVLHAAVANGCPVVIASSSEVYGPVAAVPCREDDLRTFAPATVRRSCYAISKAAAEQMALATADQFNLPVIILRLFNTIGERQNGRHGMVVPSFVDQALSGESLTVLGDGSQTRCFIDVVDVVEAMLGLVENPEAFGRVINVGSPYEISVLELARRVLRRIGRDPEDPAAIRFVPHEEVFGADFTDVPRRVPSIELVQQLTGWSPRVLLEESLSRVIEERSISRG